MFRVIPVAVLFSLLLVSCRSESSGTSRSTTAPAAITVPESVKIAGAMKNVMRKGELAGVIRIDTINNRTGLYGLGPVAFLRGELLIVDGKSYRSVVTSDSTMRVDATYDVQAPFFVYGNVTAWDTLDLPDSIRSARQLESFIDDRYASSKDPFIFRLTGKVKSARIHVQNLPEGSTVSSPAEAHRGQVSYRIEDREAMIVGFHSRKHQGVFTHHDSFVHLHLITADKSIMGHLDEVNMGEMTLLVAR